MTDPMINPPDTHRTVFISPIHGERWCIALRIPEQPTEGATFTTHLIPPCLRNKMAALNIAGTGYTHGLGWRSSASRPRGGHSYEVYITQAEADELAQYFEER